jgi:hypothetical protein
MNNAIPAIRPAQPRPAEPQDPIIRSLLEQLDAVILDAKSLAGDMTAEEFNWQPGPRRWSVGQCLQHITLTARLYLEPVQAMTEQARKRQSERARPYREGAFTRWFVRSMEPPPSLRIRTFGKVEPSPRLDREAVLTDFEAVHRTLGELLSGVDSALLLQARMRSPFVSLLQFTFGQVYALNLAHARRHIWQARQVVAEPAFGS